jgi:hypothetical protein
MVSGEDREMVTVSTTVTTPLEYDRSLLAAGVGALAFPVVLGFNQVAIFKPLKISLRLPLAITATLGGLSITGAAVVASTAVVKTYNLSRHIYHQADTRTEPHSTNNQTESQSRQPQSETISLSTTELLASGVVSLVLYRALGGRFSSVLPSHLFAPGAFGIQCVPARSTSYANEIERDLMQTLGRKNGCHTCGVRKKSTKYVADHQPPNKFVNSNNSGNNNVVLQKFYPQCRSCSNQQGVSLLNDASPVISHPLALRLHHVFFPIPLGLVFLKHILTPPVDSTESIALNKEEESVVTPTKVVEVTPSHQPEQRKLSDLLVNFPVLIIWNKIMSFLDSFHPCDKFHMTLWAFSIIAALGTT